MATRPQIRMMHGQMNRLGLADDRDERLALISGLVHRPLTTSNDLTHDEAQTVIVAASGARTADELRALLAASEQAEAEARAAADQVDDPLPDPEVDPDAADES
jgi:hypothetical protein